MIGRLAMPRGYQHRWLRDDLIAGATVTAYPVPQVMAYATIAGVAPVAGVWAALPALATSCTACSSRSACPSPTC
ncbi:MAG TPA: SulP family inorganic anion transporter [Streptosporangiaceae bacterium]|nr:SulP family inorganic anion transporter [Streptosporangiaceae bacterium]